MRKLLVSLAFFSILAGCAHHHGSHSSCCKDGGSASAEKKDCGGCCGQGKEGEKGDCKDGKCKH